MASGHVNRTNRPNTSAAPTTAARVKKALANPEPSTHGPRLPSWEMRRVGSYLGYTGHEADAGDP